jgi:hypothetical protein
MIKRLDKKAQNMSIGTLVGLALAIIVLVFVVLGFTRGWGYIFGKTDYLPEDLETHAQACKQYEEQEVKVSYCDFRENDLGKDDVYMNCDGVHTAVGKILGKDEPHPFKGDEINCGMSSEAFCETLDDSDKSEAKVYNFSEDGEIVDCST